MLRPIFLAFASGLLWPATSSFLLPLPVSAADDLQTSVAALPTAPDDANGSGDWLVVTPVRAKTGVYRGSHPREIVMANSLVRRIWRLVAQCGDGGTG